MNHWLMKSEPSDVSIDDALAMPNATVAWYGVRGFQARNFMRDAMAIDDPVLFYHSSCPQPGVVGLARVASTAYPDETQFDSDHRYYDPESTREKPRWMLVDVQVTRKTRLVSLAELRATPELAELRILRRGNRLSITPVSSEDYATIVKLAT